MGLVDTLVNWFADTESSKTQRNWNEEMWKKQMEYNSPANQMQRFRQAGLNPNLIYGQGTSGNVDQIRGYDRPKVTSDIPDIISVLGSYQQVKTGQANEQYLRNKSITEHFNSVKADSEATIRQNEKEISNLEREYLQEKKDGKDYNAKELLRQKQELLEINNEIKRKISNLTDEQLKQAEFITKYQDFNEFTDFDSNVMKVFGEIMNYLTKQRLFKAR